SCTRRHVGLMVGAKLSDVNGNMMFFREFEDLCEISSHGLPVRFRILPFRSQPGIGSVYPARTLMCKRKGIVVMDRQDYPVILGEFKFRDAGRSAVIRNTHQHDAR